MTIELHAELEDAVAMWSSFAYEDCDCDHMPEDHGFDGCEVEDCDCWASWYE